MGRRYLDKETKNVIMLDLQGGNAASVAIALLQSRNQSPAFIAKGLQFVKFRRIAGSDEATVARGKRQIRGQRPFQPVNQSVVIAQFLVQARQLLRRRRQTLERQPATHDRGFR